MNSSPFLPGLPFAYTAKNVKITFTQRPAMPTATTFRQFHWYFGVCTKVRVTVTTAYK
jgi:hypothetical protein